MIIEHYQPLHVTTSLIITILDGSSQITGSMTHVEKRRVQWHVVSSGCFPPVFLPSFKISSPALISDAPYLHTTYTRWLCCFSLRLGIRLDFILHSELLSQANKARCFPTALVRLSVALLKSRDLYRWMANSRLTDWTNQPREWGARTNERWETFFSTSQQNNNTCYPNSTC